MRAPSRPPARPAGRARCSRSAPRVRVRVRVGVRVGDRAGPPDADWPAQCATHVGSAAGRPRPASTVMVSEPHGERPASSAPAARPPPPQPTAAVASPPTAAVASAAASPPPPSVGPRTQSPRAHASAAVAGAWPSGGGSPCAAAATDAGGGSPGALGARSDRTAAALLERPRPRPWGLGAGLARALREPPAARISRAETAPFVGGGAATAAARCRWPS
eukprot:scaffold114610_cov67-Phaeocystis_antarctica.AAC.2